MSRERCRTLVEDIYVSEDYVIAETDKNKIAEELSEPYWESLYNYDTLSIIHKEMRQMHGLTTVHDEPNNAIPFTSLMYMTAIRLTLYFMVSFLICRALLIYLFAFLGWSITETPQFGSTIVDYFLIPATKLQFDSTFVWIDDHIVDPISITGTCVLFFFILRVMENKFKIELQQNDHHALLLSVHLKNVETDATDEEISDLVDEICCTPVQKSVSFVFDTLGIEADYEEYNNLLIKVKGLEGHGNRVEEHLREEQDRLKARITEKEERLVTEAAKLRSGYVLVTFYSYQDTYLFIQKAMEWKGHRDDASQPKVFKRFFAESDINFAPDCYDIEWAAFKPYSLESKLIHLGMCFLFFFVLPIVTYFLEYTFCLKFAMVFLDGKNLKIENTLLFDGLRLVISSIYSQICSMVIDKYYSNIEFKTLSDRNSSKFYFYNFYFMLNQIAADFYGIISAGVKSIQQMNSMNIVRNHQAFIFKAAFKVGLMLLFSPFIQIFMTYLNNMLSYLKIKFFSKSSVMRDALNRDSPRRHDLGNMSSFLVQCVFFAAFFSDFYMPSLSLVVLVGIVIFFLMERHLITSWYVVQKGVNTLNIKMIYTMMFWSFIVGDFLSVGNSKLILEYFVSFNFLTLHKLLARSMEFTLMFFALIFNALISAWYKETKLRMRILAHLAATVPPENLRREDEPFVNLYKTSNPYNQICQVLFFN